LLYNFYEQGIKNGQIKTNKYTLFLTALKIIDLLIIF